MPAFPRAAARGPIEAFCPRVSTLFLLHFREQLLAAPLKRIKIRTLLDERSDFREQLLAAPLKRTIRSLHRSRSPHFREQLLAAPLQLLHPWLVAAASRNF